MTGPNSPNFERGNAHFYRIKSVKCYGFLGKAPCISLLQEESKEF